MERNRWETAIRCLEIAVHPNTSDEEVIAAINGFRRTANATSLGRLRRTLSEAAAADDESPLAEGRRRLDQLISENLRLRRKIHEAETERAAALQRAQDAGLQAKRVSEELLVAEHRADVAEQRLAEFHSPYGRISGGVHHESLDLQRALDEAKRNLAQPIHEPVLPFQNLLNAALQRPDQPPSGQQLPTPNRPWTA